MKNEQSYVYLSSPTNSTMFTTCCDTAICDDQTECPRCGKLVYGWDSDNIRQARWKYAYKPNSN